jgi:alpha-N-arabinofuranosidase
MTGMERNADIVTMASYAPLFAHVDGWQWTPNLIWFDNASSYMTPSYYVQQMFSLNAGTHTISMRENANGKNINGQDSIWASAVIDQKTNEVILKIVNPSGNSKKKNISLNGMANAKGILTVLQNSNPGIMNSLERPDNISPVKKEVSMNNQTLSVDLPAYSLSVVRLKM